MSTGDANGDAAQQQQQPQPEMAGEEPFAGMLNATAQLGVTVYLHCKVNNLGGNVVSYTTTFMLLCPFA